MPGTARPDGVVLRVGGQAGVEEVPFHDVHAGGQSFLLKPLDQAGGVGIGAVGQADESTLKGYRVSFDRGDT
jgi:hypothetical protein